MKDNVSCEVCSKIAIIQCVNSAQVFARKVVPFVEDSTQDKVKDEAHIMSELVSAGKSGYRNIITILRHGQLKPAGYFIDMELGDFTLESYIYSYFGSSDHNVNWASFQGRGPVVVEKNCDTIASLENWCTIGCHIASGLDHIHSLKYVHRDLKPANGSQIN